MNEMTLDQVLTKHHKDNAIVDVDEPTVKLVVFALGNDWFAFHGNHIREILAQVDVFFVPGCPPSIEGVINVRGDIESVIRPRELLGLPDSGAYTCSSVLLGRGGGVSSGVRVDRVIDVIDAPQSSVQPPPATLPERMRLLALGVVHFQEHLVIVLNIETMFAEFSRGLG